MPHILGKHARGNPSPIFGVNLGDAITGDGGGKWLFKKRHFDDDGNDSELPVLARLRLFYLLIFLILAIFISRLFLLTIVQGDKNRDLADNNRIKFVEIVAERGKIFDRKGVILSESKTSYLLKGDKKTTQITASQAKELEEQGLAGENFEGELGQIFQVVKRNYLLGEAAVHVLGYTTASPFQSMGNGGAEEVYDQFLRGQNGKQLIEVDATGRNISILGAIPPESGRDIHTTVDSDLQKVVFEIITKHADKAGSRRGAAIVSNPQTGEILALVSVPSFDPLDVAKYLEDENKPFFNRAIQGSYPPGSVFKIVSALAGLESGVISKDSQIEDVGEFKIANDRFVNWYYLTAGKKDGFLKVDRAIARSNDIFFYRIAEKTGLETIRKMAIKFGMGQKTGVDLPDEAFGLVPDEAWKQSAYGLDWFLGDTLHLGIGQGFMLSTPLQINSLTSFMASGKLERPYLVSQIDGKDGAGTVKIESKILGENLVGAENFKVVREGMRQACEQGGTAFPFFNAPYKVGCKTGTAEKTLGNPHAWFTAFAPFDNPQISVTVIIEDGGEGSRVSAPAAREILDWWFANRK
ncbi:hypothetical protein HYS90_00210 [Candidatus Curtissbacteria bacterium]|nr:hypothetical protein [Candidatus Curtissbacteria bacterium]